MLRKFLFLIALVTASALVLSGCTIIAGSETQPETYIEEDIDWLEISPLMSVTTYVDDYAVISQVTSLINDADLQPVPESEIEEILRTQPDPAELILNGTAYPRNIRVEFIRSGSQLAATVHFFGGYIGINEQYYSTAAPVTDNFLAVLDDIFSRGLGKGAIE